MGYNTLSFGACIPRLNYWALLYIALWFVGFSPSCTLYTKKFKYFLSKKLKCSETDGGILVFLFIDGGREVEGRVEQMIDVR
jgi:hypothetical protein